MPEPVTTNTVKAPTRSGAGPQERKVFVSLDHPAKKMNVAFDPSRYRGVIPRTPRTGLPALQTQDLRIMADKKRTLQVMAEKKVAQAAAAARKSKAPAKAKGSKRSTKKGK